MSIIEAIRNNDAKELEKAIYSRKNPSANNNAAIILASKMAVKIVSEIDYDEIDYDEIDAAIERLTEENVRIIKLLLADKLVEINILLL